MTIYVYNNIYSGSKIFLKRKCDASSYTYRKRQRGTNDFLYISESHLKDRKGKVEYLYSAFKQRLKALRHGSHSFTSKLHAPCLPFLRKRSPDGASTKCGGEHLIAAHYSFIDPKRMKDCVGLVG